MGLADIKNAFHQVRILGWLQAFLCTASCSRIQSWLHRKNDRPKTASSRLIDLSCLCDTSSVFSWCMFCVKLSRTTVRSLEVLTLLLCIVTTPHRRCSVANTAWDPLASLRRVLALTRGANCTNVHLARLICRCKGSRSRCARHIPCQRMRVCSRLRRVSSQRKVQWSGQTDISYWLSRTYGLFAQSHLRLGGGVWRATIVAIRDANFKLARASYLASGEPWSSVRT